MADLKLSEIIVAIVAIVLTMLRLEFERVYADDRNAEIGILGAFDKDTGVRRVDIEWVLGIGMFDPDLEP